MKKLFLMLLCLSALNVNSTSAENREIDLDIEIIDDTPAGPGHSKTVVHMPRIYQDAHKLTLSSFHPEFIINIVKDDEVVYSSVVPASVTEFELPSYLSGEYIINIVKGKFCFWGYLSL